MIQPQSLIPPPSNRQEYTHQKRPYRARCVQFDGYNYDIIVPLFKDATKYGEDHIMVRYGHGIVTLRVGDWTVIGEDGRIRVYSDEVFHIKYETQTA